MYIVYIDIFNYWKLSWALEEQDASKKMSFGIEHLWKQNLIYKLATQKKHSHIMLTSLYNDAI